MTSPRAAMPARLLCHLLVLIVWSAKRLPHTSHQWISSISARLARKNKALAVPQLGGLRWLRCLLTGCSARRLHPTAHMSGVTFAAEGTVSGTTC